MGLPGAGKTTIATELAKSLSAVHLNADEISQISREIHRDLGFSESDRIAEGRFEDTNRLFVPPLTYDIRITSTGSKEYWETQICNRIFAMK